MIYSVYPIVTGFGLPAEVFWDITYGEVIDFMERKQREKRQERKEQISDTFLLSDLIGLHLSRMLNSEVKIPRPAEVYPDLFEEEYQEKYKDMDMELYKARMTDFALRHNHTRHK